MFHLYKKKIAFVGVGGLLGVGWGGVGVGDNVSPKIIIKVISFSRYHIKVPFSFYSMSFGHLILAWNS